MTQHNPPSQSPSEDGLWEETLRQWAQTFSPPVLGMRLTALLRQITSDDLHPLLEAIAQEYRQPEDERRWQIFDQAKALDFSSPIGALALSQFWSHGSMSPEGLPPVYPQAQLSVQMLHCALVTLAAQLAENPAEGACQLIARSTTLEVE